MNKMFPYTKKIIIFGLILLFTLVISACEKVVDGGEEPVKKLYEVSPYVTAGNKSKLLDKGNDVTTSFDENSAGIKLSLNPEITYQTMDGFGAAMTESSAYLLMNLDSNKRAEVMESLFGKEEGISLSFVRIAMGASDFSLDNFTYNDTVDNQPDLELTNFSIERDEAYVIPILKEAKLLNDELLIMGTPWSAPAWMKDNLNLNGGKLKTNYHDTYANYFVKFIDAYQAHGLNIYAVTPQNEPLHQTSGYPSMYMLPDQQSNLIVSMGEAFESNDIDTLIMAYDHNWDRMDYPISVINSDAYDYVAGTALHGYGGNVKDTQRVVNAFPEKGVWFTEISGGLWATNFADNMTWNMENIFMGSINLSAKGVLMWNIALDQNNGPKNGGCTNCRGVLTVNTETDVITKNEEYYIIGHFSKFVRKGALRIDAQSNNANLITSAFKNPDGSIVVVVHNKTNSQLNFQLNIHESNVSYQIPAKGTISFVLNELA